MHEETNYPCPLLNRDMWDAECYDVQMVRNRFIKPEILDFTLDRSKADNFCGECPFNQLKLPAAAIKNTLKRKNSTAQRITRS